MRRPPSARAPIPERAAGPADPPQQAAPRELDLVVERLAAGGDGVAHAADGRVVFVPFVVPGDRVRVRVTSDGARFARARVVALLAPGAARRAPACAVFGECGGCAWQQVDYAAQLAAKREILRDALGRVGGVAFEGPLEIVPSPAPYGYRGRARVLVERGRVGFRRLRSNAICATDRCPVLAPALEAALADLARRPPHDDGEWEIALGEGDETRSTPIGVYSTSARRGGRRSTTRASVGAPLVQRVGEDRIGITPGVFAQANALLFEPLAAAVHEAAGRGDLVLELFAGAGFLTLGLARRFVRVVAVEADPAAVRDLTRNLADAGRTAVDVRRATAERALAGWREPRPDVVVLDPPRGGLARDGARSLARVGAPRVVYVSCDPATLARDAAVLAANGYGVTAVQGFDLFPQTPHVEALLVMERR